MKTYYLLLAFLCCLGVPVLAGNKHNAKANLSALFASIAAADCYSYQIKTSSAVLKTEAALAEKEQVSTQAVYYFSRKELITYYCSAQRLTLFCKLGYFNCDEQRRMVSYTLYDTDSAYMLYAQQLQSASMVQQMDSMFFHEAVVTPKKNKGGLQDYQVDYPKSAFGDRIVVTCNSNMQQLVAIHYTITQQLETGILVKHKVIIDHYGKQAPPALQSLLNAIHGDLKAYLIKHYDGYTIVNTNGL